MDNHIRPPVTGYPTTTPHSNGYPYPAPQQNPYYPDPRATRRATLFRRVSAVIIASVIITGIIILILWLILRPQIPHFQVQSFSISNFSISSSSRLTANWVVSLTVANPNHKLTLNYNPIKAVLFYRGVALSETMMEPFSQGTKNETTLTVRFGVVGALVDGDLQRGSVGFGVRVMGRVRFRAGSWRARRRVIRVLCGGLVVGLTTNGTAGSMVGGPRECRVGL